MHSTHIAFRNKNRGFSLVEMLTVLVIILTLSALSVTAIGGIVKASRFDQALSSILETLATARSYAIAQDTYVWVAFYPVDPSQLGGGVHDATGDQVVVATFASSEGNNPLPWSGTSTYTIPYTDTASSTVVSQLNKVQTFKQLRIWPQGGNGGSYFSIPSVPTTATPSPAAAAPLLAVAWPAFPAQQLSSQPTPTGQNAIALLVFNPRGSALVGSTLSSSIGLDFQPVKGPGTNDTTNLATIRIDGLTGIAALYRQ